VRGRVVDIITDSVHKSSIRGTTRYALVEVEVKQ